MMNKKFKILFPLLLIADLILNLLAPEPSKVAFAGIWIVAIALWRLVCCQEDTIHLLEEIKRIDTDTIDAQSERIERQSKMILYFMTNGGYTKLISKAEALPKVVSATGQTYVDFDDVMCILEGGDIVER